MKAPSEDNSENTASYLYGIVVTDCNFVLNDNGSTDLYIKFEASEYKFMNTVLLDDDNYELNEPEKEVKYAITFDQQYWT